MELLLLLIIIFLTTAIHELGHAFAMKRHGYVIKEICLLGFGPKLFSWRTRFFPHTVMSVRLLPLGGFVAGYSNKDQSLSNKIDVNLGGIIGNARLALAVLCIFLVYILLNLTEQKVAIFTTIPPKKVLIFLGILLLIVMCSFRKTVIVAFPFIGGIGVYLILDIFLSAPESKGVVSGTLTLAEFTTDITTAAVMLVVIQMITIVANIAPIPPLDGGHVLKDILVEKFPEKESLIENISTGVTIIVAGGLVYATFIGDIKAFIALFH